MLALWATSFLPKYHPLQAISKIWWYVRHVPPGGGKGSIFVNTITILNTFTSSLDQWPPVHHLLIIMNFSWDKQLINGIHLRKPQDYYDHYPLYSAAGASSQFQVITDTSGHKGSKIQDFWRQSDSSEQIGSTNKHLGVESRQSAKYLYFSYTLYTLWWWP